MTPGYLTCEISQRPRWITFYLGLGVNAAGVLVLLALNPHLQSSVLAEPVVISHYVTLVAPTPQPLVTSVPVMVPLNPKIAKIARPHLAPPPPHEEPPQPKNVEVARAQPVPETVAKAESAKPAAPVKQVKTNVLDSKKSDLALVQEPARRVQTGGFGDPNGLAGRGEPRRETTTAMRVGSFDLPAGPGRGNGTSEAGGVSGRIHTSEFGDASAQPTLEARNKNVAASGFGDVVQAQTTEPHLPTQSEIQPVQILFKPQPTYTQEARRKGVQGEVLLDVVFEASGALHINRVVKGLGYGLDDMAMEAAKKIQFRPAVRDGQPYDYAALVHIRFELAD